MGKAKLISSWKDLVAYSSDGPQHTELMKTEDYNAVLVGLEANQQIPPHPAPAAVYHFLEGSGVMIVDGERMSVGQGATVAVPAGSARGIEADTRLTLLASHGVPNLRRSAPMPMKRMGLIGLVGTVVMIGVMVVLGFMIGRGNPMATLMFQIDGPLGMGLWALMIVPPAVMLVMMGGMFLTYRRMAGMAGHDHAHHGPTNMTAADTRTFNVPAVSCEHCKMTIETEIGGMAGVSSAQVNVKARTATISFAPPAVLSEIADRLAEIGYPADGA